MKKKNTIKVYMVIIPFKGVVGIFSTKEKAIEATKRFDDWCNIAEINVDEIKLLRLPNSQPPVLK